MPGPIADLRRQVAQLARKYLDGDLSFKKFLLALPREVEVAEDDEVAELVDLIEHEPSVGRLFGVTGAEHRLHMDRVRQLIAVLEEK